MLPEKQNNIFNVVSDNKKLFISILLTRPVLMYSLDELNGPNNQAKYWSNLKKKKYFGILDTHRLWNFQNCSLQFPRGQSHTLQLLLSNSSKSKDFPFMIVNNIKKQQPYLLSCYQQTFDWKMNLTTDSLFFFHL